MIEDMGRWKEENDSLPIPRASSCLRFEDMLELLPEPASLPRPFSPGRPLI